MSRRGDERIVAGIAIAACGIAALTYLASIPRQGGVGPRAAAATATAHGAAAGATAAARPATPPAAPQVDLAITIWPHGPGRGRLAWSVTCPPMTAACRAALGRTRTLAQEPPGPCTGTRPRDPEAIVTGFINGRHVAAWVDQRDACGMRRWTALRPLLTPPKERTRGTTSR